MKRTSLVLGLLSIGMIFFASGCANRAAAPALETPAASTSASSESIGQESTADVASAASPTDPPSTPLPSETVPPLPSATPLPQPRYTEPTILNIYSISDIPFHPGGAEGVVLALPGQVWTAAMFSGLQQLDPLTGEVLMKITDIDAQFFYDLKVENERLWVLSAREPGGDADSLYALDLPGGEVAGVVAITDDGSYSADSAKLGVSPGKVWVNYGIVDAETLQYTEFPSGLPGEAQFAFDGQRWMWITGTWCDGCNHDLWILDADDPPNHRDHQNSGVLNTGVLGSPMVLAGGRMWVSAAYFEGETTYFLDVYDLDQSAAPMMHIDVTEEVSESGGYVRMTADDRMVWLESNGTLYYYDISTGEKKGQLTVGEYVTSLSFDGTSLWVLCSDVGLLQVYLPWQESGAAQP